MSQSLWLTVQTGWMKPTGSNEFVRVGGLSTQPSAVVSSQARKQILKQGRGSLHPKVVVFLLPVGRFVWQ